MFFFGLCGKTIQAMEFAITARKADNSYQLK